MKSAGTAKADLGIFRSVVRVARIPCPGGPTEFESTKEIDLEWKRYDWLFMTDGKSKAQAIFYGEWMRVGRAHSVH